MLLLVACQAPLSMGFPRQENCHGLPFSSPGHLPVRGVKPRFPALAGEYLTDWALKTQVLAFLKKKKKKSQKTKAVLWSPHSRLAITRHSCDTAVRSRQACIRLSFSRESFQPGNWTRVSCIGRWILYHWATRCFLLVLASSVSQISDDACRLPFWGRGVKNQTGNWAVGGA